MMTMKTIHKLKEILKEIPARKHTNIGIRIGNCVFDPINIHLNKIKNYKGNIVEYELILVLVNTKDEWLETLKEINPDEF